MNDAERERLLGRLDRQSTSLGGRIPDRITVQGTEIDLREFVFEVKRLDTVPPEEEERVEEVKRKLKRERLRRRQRIETDDVSYEEGERLVASVVGLDRALNALDSLDSAGFEETARRERIAGQREWLAFLRQIR